MNPHEKPEGRQHALKKPCKECPFAKATDIETVRASVDPRRLIGQSISPFVLPCHSDPEYLGGGRSENLAVVSQCAGAAIYRSNIGVAGAFPAFFHILPEDKDTVFASHAELLARFAGTDETMALCMLTLVTPQQLANAELTNPNVKVTRGDPPA